ncbi:MAG: DinB family protein [Actinomycetota bacterium]|nr:DUF1572 domain-containing protein [Actinomycetota bacterium]
MKESDSFIRELAAAFSLAHAQIAKQIRDLSDDALAWTPAVETNSISTLVVHVLGSEAELLRLIKGLPAPRDRPAEFSGPPKDAATLLAKIDVAEDLLNDIGSQIGEADLRRSFLRPSAVRIKEPGSGLFWIINGYGHAREHLAHIELTRQLYERSK